jgi:hypothetical protein
MTTNLLANIPTPAGAGHVGEWIDLDTPTPFRFFEGSRRLVERPDRGNADVWIIGVQHADGAARDIDVVLRMPYHDESLTVVQARQLAAALLAAADEADEMNGIERSTVS